MLAFDKQDKVQFKGFNVETAVIGSAIPKHKFLMQTEPEKKHVKYAS